MTISPAPARCEIHHDSMIFCPNGTVSMHVDGKHQALRVFSEEQPHPEDWEIACKYIGRSMGGLREEYHDEDIIVFVVNIVPEVMESCQVCRASAVA